MQRVKHGIEHSTATEEMPGLMCWFDLERMKGDSQQAMKDGVEQSGLVVVFLDMAYLKSAACNTELTAARQKGKHIVPIVLPGLVEELKANKDGMIAESARFLMPTEASDANVSVPLYVDAADPIEERAAKQLPRRGRHSPADVSGHAAERDGVREARAACDQGQVHQARLAPDWSQTNLHPVQASRGAHRGLITNQTRQATPITPVKAIAVPERPSSPPEPPSRVERAIRC